jgi:hypothetical protein
MGPSGWQVGFYHSAAIAQTTVSCSKLSVSFTDVHCFHDVWIETLLQLFNVFYASTNCSNFIKNELTFLCLLTFYIFITGVS